MINLGLPPALAQDRTPSVMPCQCSEQEGLSLSKNMPFPSQKPRGGKAATKPPCLDCAGFCRGRPLLGRAAVCFLSLLRPRLFLLLHLLFQRLHVFLAAEHHARDSSRPGVGQNDFHLAVAF